MTGLNNLAPYPRTEDAATAEAMAKSLAVRTQANFVRALDLPPGHPDERAAFNALVSNFAIVYLLRALAEHAPERADEAARGLWSEWEAGDGIGEWAWEWLTEWGIDPEQVRAITEAAMAKEQVQAEATR